MIVSRDGHTPLVAPTATVAASAQVVGNVTVGERCFIDYNVVIESSGPAVTIADETVILANSVIRSCGGKARPPFPVSLGRRTLIGPLCALAGCAVGAECYIATGVMIFQGVEIGDNTRVGAGAIVHLRSRIPSNSHIGMRHIAVPHKSGYRATADVLDARRAIHAADFFGTVFEEVARGPKLHAAVIDRLLQEVLGWHDSSVGDSPSSPN